MATDGQLSFISFVYLDIQWGVGAQVGFNAGDGVSFMAPGALTPATVEMEEMSNINVSGVFLFHVNDQSGKCKQILMTQRCAFSTLVQLLL